MLYDEHDITLFLFQDDDFPVYRPEMAPMGARLLR